MENISHVNGRIFLKVIFFPFLLLSLLFKYLSCKKEAKKYTTNKSELSLEERYGKFLSFYKRSLLFKNTAYTFISKKKIIKSQIIFVVNEDFDWESIALLSYMVRNYKPFFPSFLLHSLPLKKTPSILWRMIDSYYGYNNFSRAMDSKRSIFIEKNLLCKNLDCAEKIKNSRLSIIPIFKHKDKNRIFYKLGETIKMDSLINIKTEFIEDFIDKSFDKLSKELNDSIGKLLSKKRSVIREFFSLK